MRPTFPHASAFRFHEHARARPRARHGLAGAALALACLATLVGVTSAREPAQAVQPAQPPVFRTGVDLVVVEATAIDKAGRAVRGLGPLDFRAEIGGHRREVVSAEFVEYEHVSPAELADADITTNIDETPSRAILVIVDQSSLQFENRGVLEGAKRWLATLDPADRLGFAGLPAPGPVVDFTTDHEKVIAAFSELKAGMGPSPVPHFNRNVSLWEAFQIVERNDTVRAEVVARECRPRDPTCPGEVFDNARAIALDSDRRVSPVLSGLQAVLRGLGAMPGPKHVVLVSSGWPIEERNAANLIAALAEDAAASNAMVHVFTAEEWATSASLPHLSPRRTFDQNLMLSSVESLAASTGGRAVRLAGSGEAAFTALDAGLSGYYRLAVRPGPEDLDGKSKRIGLDVARAGVSLLGYRRVMAGARPSAAPPAADSAAVVREALRSGTPLTGLGLKATSYVLHGESDPASVRVLVTGEVTRAAEGPATAIAVLFGPDGRSVAGTEQTLQITAAGRARVTTTLSVNPGAYVLRLAVGDREGRAGSLERSVYATWHEAGEVFTTGLVLLRSPGGGGGALEPLFDVLSTEDQLIAQLPLSGPLAPANGRVTFEVARMDGEAPALRVTGRVGRTSTGALVAEGTVAASSLAPGRYAITATLEPGAAPPFVRTFRAEAPGR